MSKIKNIPLIILLILLISCNNQPSDNIKNDFNIEELEYYVEIAFGSEFRKKNNPTALFWRNDIEVQLNRNYTQDDSLEVLRVIQELNLLIDPIEIKLVETGGNLNMYFDRTSTFKSFPTYVPGNFGYFKIERIAFLPKAYILVDMEQSIIRRKHIIREELTQVLGLTNDSYLYPESIFFQGYSTITEYSEIDRQLIRLMYNYNLPYAMRKSEFIDFISTSKQNRPE